MLYASTSSSFANSALLSQIIRRKVINGCSRSFASQGYNQCSDKSNGSLPAFDSTKSRSYRSAGHHRPLVALNASNPLLSNFGRFNSSLFSSRFFVGHAPLRFNSSSSQSSTSAIPDISPMDIPPPPVPAPEASMSLEKLAEALQGIPGLGDSMFPPANWMGYGLDWAKDCMGIEWWAAIIGASIVMRLLTFPVMIMSRRFSTQMQLLAPRMTKASQNLEEARASGDQLGMKLAQMEVADLQSRMKISRKIIPWVVQGFTFVTFFTALRSMASGPVPGFESEGLWWLKDLSIADPTWKGPLICATSMLLIIETSAETGSKTNLSPTGKKPPFNPKWMMRLIPLGILGFSSSMPGAVLLYWSASNSMAVALAGIMKVRPVQKALGIPVSPPRSNEDRVRDIKKSIKRSVKKAKSFGYAVTHIGTTSRNVWELGKTKVRDIRANNSSDPEDKYEALKRDVPDLPRTIHKADPIAKDLSQYESMPDNQEKKRVVKSARQIEQEMRLKQRRKQIRI